MMDDGGNGHGNSSGCWDRSPSFDSALQNSSQRPADALHEQQNKIRIFGARRANATGLGPREPNVEDLALASSIESGNLSLDTADIRWMPDKAKQSAGALADAAGGLAIGGGYA